MAFSYLSIFPLLEQLPLWPVQTLFADELRRSAPHKVQFYTIFAAGAHQLKTASCKQTSSTKSFEKKTLKQDKIPFLRLVSKRALNLALVMKIQDV